MLYIGCIISFIGFLFMCPNDTMSIPCIILSSLFGLITLALGVLILAKAYEKHTLDYFHLHFVHPNGYHKYIKAYTYAGKFKAIHDLKQNGYVLYAQTEYTKEDN